ncbi:MAG: tetratricopeptide repeat protein [Candidatus Zixiibacteriota bacterium]
MDENTVIVNCDDTLARKGYPPAIACNAFAKGEYAKAVDLCLQYMEKHPDSLSARLIMARSLYHAGEIDRARDHFQKALKLDANNLVALKYLGDILFADGQEAMAMSYYRRVFELDPHNTGMSCPVSRIEESRTRRVILKGLPETIKPDKKPMREPAFVTETVGDIYRDQGYLELAGEVYRRLLTGSENNRIATKLREVEATLTEKEKKHEGSHR